MVFVKVVSNSYANCFLFFFPFFFWGGGGQGGLNKMHHR